MGFGAGSWAGEESGVDTGSALKNMLLQQTEFVDKGDRPNHTKKLSLMCYHSRVLDVRTRGTLLRSSRSGSHLEREREVGSAGSMG